jgi:N-acetylglucosamine malate deacetylase 1
MKLDILVFAAHPDDAELAASGTIMRMIALGHKVGIVDLTAGELGTRGTVEIRAKESTASSVIMGVHVRENLGMRDGFFLIDEAHQLQVIQMIRRYQPEVILINAPTDRHPDHGRGSELVRNAAFLSGLRRIQTLDDGQAQASQKGLALYPGSTLDARFRRRYHRLLRPQTCFYKSFWFPVL